MTCKQIEALRFAMEALEAIAWSNNTTWQSQRAKIEVDAIKEALAEQQQEKHMKTTIELAREAAGDEWGLFRVFMPEIHKFAELVRADERARSNT